MPRKKPDAIEVALTWSGMLPALLAMYQNGGTAAVRNAAFSELNRMAKIADSATPAEPEPATQAKPAPARK